MHAAGEQPMTKDKEGPYVRPPQILAEVLRALLTFRQRLASQLLTLTIDIAPPDVSSDIRQVVFHRLHVPTRQEIYVIADLCTLPLMPWL